MNNKPRIQSGKFFAGVDFSCGKNVVINVSEECIVGNRVVLADDTRIEGRRVEIGNDFYGYSWDYKRLDIGRGRVDEESALMSVGDRCTFHDNRIDLAEPVFIGDDVGLSPEVAIYTHGYWLNPLDGFPTRYSQVLIGRGVIIGFRCVILPGTTISANVVVGAQSVIRGELESGWIFGGSPAQKIRMISRPSDQDRLEILLKILDDYSRRCQWKGRPISLEIDFPVIRFRGCLFNIETLETSGEEDEYTDDFRDFFFKHGIRFYTERPFKKLKK